MEDQVDAVPSKQELLRRKRCEVSRRAYARNRQRIAAYHKTYVELHKDEVSEYQRQYHKQHSESLREQKQQASRKYERLKRERLREQKSVAAQQAYANCQQDNVDDLLQTDD